MAHPVASTMAATHTELQTTLLRSLIVRLLLLDQRHQNGPGRFYNKTRMLRDGLTWRADHPNGRFASRSKQLSPFSRSSSRPVVPGPVLANGAEIAQSRPK